MAKNYSIIAALYDLGEYYPPNLSTIPDKSLIDGVGEL
jgi:hypothetical protein